MTVVTIPRVVATFVLALLAMSGVFAWRYSDLLYLRKPVATIEVNGRQTFDAQAERALARATLTRRHLDTIADAAARFGDAKLEAEALLRRHHQDPRNREIQLRLADALRRAGDFVRAEAQYRDVIRATGGDSR